MNGERLGNMFLIANKPPNVSSLSFANMVKSSLNRQGFHIKKIGFLGTLDPFASGNLILACNDYTRLLGHIKSDYKTYEATLFLGLISRSLDIENVSGLDVVPTMLRSDLEGLIVAPESIMYTPPEFSAKRINGRRAYSLARDNKTFTLGQDVLDVRRFSIQNYCHPFVSFTCTVGKGGYVRSLGQIFLQRLSRRLFGCDFPRSYASWGAPSSVAANMNFIGPRDVFFDRSIPRSILGALCHLRRVSDGEFSYERCLFECPSIDLDIMLQGVVTRVRACLLGIKKAITYDIIELTDLRDCAIAGKKIYLKSVSPHIYLADFGEFYSVIEVSSVGEVKYILNRVSKC